MTDEHVVEELTKRKIKGGSLTSKSFSSSANLIPKRHSELLLFRYNNHHATATTSAARSETTHRIASPLSAARRGIVSLDEQEQQQQDVITHLEMVDDGPLVVVYDEEVEKNGELDQRYSPTRRELLLDTTSLSSGQIPLPKPPSPLSRVFNQHKNPLISVKVGNEKTTPKKGLQQQQTSETTLASSSPSVMRHSHPKLILSTTNTQPSKSPKHAETLSITTDYNNKENMCVSTASSSSSSSFSSSSSSSVRYNVGSLVSNKAGWIFPENLSIFSKEEREQISVIKSQHNDYTVFFDFISVSDLYLPDDDDRKAIINPCLVLYSVTLDHCTKDIQKQDLWRSPVQKHTSNPCWDQTNFAAGFDVPDGCLLTLELWDRPSDKFLGRIDIFPYLIHFLKEQLNTTSVILECPSFIGHHLTKRWRGYKAMSGSMRVGMEVNKRNEVHGRLQRALISTLPLLLPLPQSPGVCCRSSMEEEVSLNSEYS